MSSCKQFPLHDWKTYLRWHLIDAFASYLSKPFVDQNFRMTLGVNRLREIIASLETSGQNGK